MLQQFPKMLKNILGGERWSEPYIKLVKVGIIGVKSDIVYERRL